MTRTGHPLPESAIVRGIGLLLAASVVGLFPFTIYSTMLVPIADDVGSDVAAVGLLRGLGGAAALAVGIGVAPVLGRWAKSTSAGVALVLLAGVSLVATIGSYPALVVFCVGIGTATALLGPVLLGLASERFADVASSSRAATLVTAAQSIAAVVAAPVIGAIALLGGWRGALWVTSAAGFALAVAFFSSPRTRRDPSAPRLRYGDTFKVVLTRSGLVLPIAVSFLRTTSFMGYLAYIAAFYDARFQLDAVGFTLVWSLSGASFFLGNYVAGRMLSRSPSPRASRALLVAGLAAALLAVGVVFAAPVLPVALVGTVLMGVAHAAVAATVTDRIARSGEQFTTAAFSLNAAGQSLGVFIGALVGGAGLWIGETVGLAVALALPVGIGLLAVMSRGSQVRQA